MVVVEVVVVAIVVVVVVVVVVWLWSLPSVGPDTPVFQRKDDDLWKFYGTAAPRLEVALSKGRTYETASVDPLIHWLSDSESGERRAESGGQDQTTPPMPTHTPRTKSRARADTARLLTIDPLAL